MGIDQGLEQGVTGQTIGAMQTGAGGLSDRVEMADIGTAKHIGDHPAAHVVGGRHHRDRLTSDIDTEFQALAMNIGKTAAYELRVLVGDIEKDRLGPAFFHLGVDGSGDHIAAGQVAAGIIVPHEWPPVTIDQDPALAAYRFGNQKILGGGMIETGGMELDELHVGNGGPGPVSHGNAIAGGDIGVAGVEVDLTRATGGEQGDAGREGFDLAAVTLQHVGAAAGGLMGGGDHATFEPGRLNNQVNGDMVLAKGDAGMVADPLDQYPFDLAAGHVQGMDDAVLRMTALATEIEIGTTAVPTLFSFIKTDPEIEQFLDALRPVLDNHCHHLAIAETITRGQGVLDMQVKAVAAAKHRGNAPLREVGVAVHRLLLGNQGHRAKFGGLEGKHQTGHATADHQKIAVHIRHEKSLPLRGKVVCIPGQSWRESPEGPRRSTGPTLHPFSLAYQGLFLRLAGDSGGSSTP